MSWLDLHMHSDISLDGEFSPSALMRLCAGAGLRTAALADHNSVQGIPEAQREAFRLGISLVPAVELDCTISGTDLHVLGYGIDHTDPRYRAVESDVLAQKRGTSEKRMEILLEMGIHFSKEDVYGLSREGAITGEMIAEVALKDPHNRDNPLMLPYYPGGARSDNPYVNFFWDYCSFGKPAFTPIHYMSLDEAVLLITSTGGIPVLAHPGNTVQRRKALIQEIVAAGVRGMEVYSSYHSAEDIAYYRDLAERLGLFPTAGSDFHGKTKPSVTLGGIPCDGLEPEIEKRLWEEIEASRRSASHPTL